MDRQIIIIHPSELVQKGLLMVLKDAIMGEFTLLGTSSQLIDYKQFCGMELIVFTDETNAIAFKQQFWPDYTKLNNKVYYWTISSSGAESESIISLYDHAESIVSKVNEAINRKTDKQGMGADLSEREIEVLKLVALGFQNKEIADKLFISIHTVISHRKNITEKLGIKSISGLTVYAILNKYIDTQNLDLSTLL